MEESGRERGVKESGRERGVVEKGKERGVVAVDGMGKVCVGSRH